MRNIRFLRSTKGDVIPYYDVAVLGDTASGKSSIIERLLSGTFTQTYTPTAAEVYMTTLCEDDKRIACLKLFDTAGGFEFPMMLRLTIKKCQAFFVVYSVGSSKSLEIAKQQLEEITETKGKCVPRVLVGNKSDLEITKEREISFDTGLQTAVQYGCAFIETSAKADVDINMSFLSLVKKIDYTATIKRQRFVEEKLKSTGQQTTSKQKRKSSVSSVKSFLSSLSSSFSDKDSSSDSE